MVVDGLDIWSIITIIRELVECYFYWRVGMSELRFDGEFCGDWDHDWDSIGAGGGQVFEGWVNADEYEYEYDGQPDEAQEWHDFDPHC
jgi:hypothetical protein